MSHQVNITRAPDGCLKITEMGNGETTHEHYLQPGLSADAAAKYLTDLLKRLVALERVA